MLDEFFQELESANVTSSLETAPPVTESDTFIQLLIPRDLAVQIVGSDAGRQRRFRPTGTMTKNVTADQLASIERLMQLFLEDEIKRFHENRSHRAKSAEVTASADEAKVLKHMLAGYAKHLEQRWQEKNQDPRHQRSKQRLDQARDVIRQINQGLGLGDVDGRSIDQHRHDATRRLEDAKQQVNTLADLVNKSARFVAPDDVLPLGLDAWTDLHDTIENFLDDLADAEVEINSHTVFRD
ncbi:MAG: hypothetical protein R3C10_11825 [Pirellulales bacterium]